MSAFGRGATSAFARPAVLADQAPDVVRGVRQTDLHSDLSIGCTSVCRFEDRVPKFDRCRVVCRGGFSQSRLHLLLHGFEVARSRPLYPILERVPCSWTDKLYSDQFSGYSHARWAGHGDVGTGRDGPGRAVRGKARQGLNN